MARVQVLRQAIEGSSGDWQLAFQWCRYLYDDNEIQEGYRFVWRRPDGTIQAARGQARIPSIERAQALMSQARQEGWGDYDGDDEGHGRSSHPPTTAAA